MTKSSHFLEYMKIHKISLEQDLEDARNLVKRIRTRIAIRRGNGLHGPNRM